MKMWRNEQKQRQQHHQTPKTLPRFFSLSCIVWIRLSYGEFKCSYCVCLLFTWDCVCVVSAFMWYIPVTILSLTLSALWHAHCKAPFCLPACRHGNFITCPQICEAHSLRLFLSLLLIHITALTHFQHVARSQQLRTGRPYWCVRVSERACQNERAEWEQQQRERALLWAQPSVASTQRRGEYEKGSLSRWHICVVSVAFVRLELLFGFCVCTADRDACGLLAQQYYKHIHLYNTHTHRNKQHQNQHLIRIEKENHFSVCALRAF